LENVHVYPKTSYVEKLTEEGEWRSVIVDDTGVEYPFNVERSDESVQQAIIDLYILSKSDMMRTSNSSFLRTSILLKKSYQNG
jgi:DNA replication protein DnaC